MARAFIGVGANIEPEAHIHAALRQLVAAVAVTGVSTFYRTPPLGDTAQPPFINGVVAIDTDLPPLALKFDVLRRIEDAQGRRRTADKYAPRSIDLDLLVYDDLVSTTADLTLPDPEISRRPFLAIPLCELAPELYLDGSPLRAVAAAMDGSAMVPLPALTASLRKELCDES